MPKWCARGPTWSVVAGLPPTSMPRFSASNRPTPIIGRRELQLTRRAALAAAQPRLEAIDTEKQEVRAALAQAVADRDLAKPNLGFTELRAPIDGMVGNRSARTGAYATVGAQLISLVPAHGLWVDANFKENQLAQIRPGLAASIEADVLPGQVFHGHVASLAPATGAQFSELPPEKRYRQFHQDRAAGPRRILLDGAASKLGSLRPGLSVTASVDEQPSAEHVL